MISDTFPQKVYTTILCDAPWKYSEKIATGIRCINHKGPEHQYNCMTLDEIKSLPVYSITEPNSHLYLWTTNTFMEEAHQVAKVWGFKVRSILTWVKQSLGLGYHFRNCTEHVVFGVKGKLPTKRKDCRTWFDYKVQRKHSRKPDEFYDLIMSMSPGPYLEMFARQEKEGWDSFGKNTQGITPTSLL